MTNVTRNTKKFKWFKSDFWPILWSYYTVCVTKSSQILLKCELRCDKWSVSTTEPKPYLIEFFRVWVLPFFGLTLSISPIFVEASFGASSTKLRLSLVNVADSCFFDSSVTLKNGIMMLQSFTPFALKEINLDSP